MMRYSHDVPVSQQMMKVLFIKNLFWQKYNNNTAAAQNLLQSISLTVLTDTLLGYEYETLFELHIMGKITFTHKKL